MAGMLDYIKAFAPQPAGPLCLQTSSVPAGRALQGMHPGYPCFWVAPRAADGTRAQPDAALLVQPVS